MLVRERGYREGEKDTVREKERKEREKRELDERPHTSQIETL